MADVRASRRRVPVVLALLGGTGAVIVLGFLAWMFIREELAIAALRSPDPATRAAAAAALGEMGTVRAIPALLECERPEDPDEDLQRVFHAREPEYAFAALDRLERSAALPGLLLLARDEKAVRRLWAIQALGRVDAREDEALRVLDEALEDNATGVRIAAAGSILRYGRKATPYLLAALRRPDRAEQESIDFCLVQCLEAQGPLGWSVVDEIVAWLVGQHLGNRAALVRIASLDAGAWDLIGAALQGRLQGATSDALDEIAEWLRDLPYAWDMPDGASAAGLAPTLESLLHHPSPHLRDAAVPALRWCTRQVSTEMLRVSLELVRDQPEPSHTRAFLATAPSDVAALRRFLQPLQESNPDRRELLLYRLAESAEHFPAVVTLLKERGVNTETLPLPLSWAKPPRALEQLLDDVRSEELDRHTEAIERLQGMKLTAADVPILESALADPDVAVSAVAAHLIGKLGPAARVERPALEALLPKDCLTVRLHAALAICQLGVGRAELEPVFREAMQMGRLRGPAVEGLVRLRVSDPNRLRELLTDQHERLAGHAFAAINRMGDGAATAVPLLRELARDPPGPQASWAVISLASIGRAASAAAPDLERLVRQATLVEKPLALWALKTVSPTAATAALHATAFLDPDDAVTATAAAGLLELAPHAAGTVPLLVSCLRRSYRALHASVILSRIGAPSVPTLLTALDDEDADLRTWSAWTLGGMGEAAADAVAALERRLRDPDELARAAAAHALGLTGQPAERSLAALEELTKDSSSLVRRQTVTAIRRLRDPAAWRPGRRELPPADDLECGNAIEDEQEGIHLSLCERHAPP